MKHKTIQQLRDSLKKVLKRGRPGQLKKLRKAYHGKRLKKWWSSYASWECCTIAELNDAEHVGHRMKGGHHHNHIKNAHKRMRKCHICGEPIVWGCEVIGYRFSEFQCRSCRTEECREQACLVGLSFGGVTFQTRRR